jgi:hypothetical protein
LTFKYWFWKAPILLWSGQFQRQVIKKFTQYIYTFVVMAMISLLIDWANMVKNKFLTNQIILILTHSLTHQLTHSLTHWLAYSPKPNHFKRAIKIYSFRVTVAQKRWKLFPWTAFSVIHSCWWMDVDVIIKKRWTADDVTQILTTLKLKYSITLIKKNFWRYGLDNLMTKCWRNVDVYESYDKRIYYHEKI